MQPIQPYRPGGYPPLGRQWPQFGSRSLEASLGGADSIRNKLQAKRDTMQSYHLGRLAEVGLTPLYASLAPPQTAPQPDPSQVNVAAHDLFDIPPPVAQLHSGLVGPGESVASKLHQHSHFKVVLT